jgi:hypothetical protein
MSLRAFLFLTRLLAAEQESAAGANIYTLF